MARVIGLGGLFFKAKNPEKLYTWYEKNLGLKRDKTSMAVLLSWADGTRSRRKGMTVWSIFPANTKYFRPSRAGFMMNFAVDDLDGMLARLRRNRAKIDPKVEDYGYGRFGWVMDPEGNRIELWEPAKR
jgi:predicted enzyme related to lactoylglutathione lyase